MSLADGLKAAVLKKAAPPSSPGDESSPADDAWEDFAEACSIPKEKRARARRMLRLWMEEK